MASWKWDTLYTVAERKYLKFQLLKYYMLAEKKLCSCHFIKYSYKLAGRHYLKLSCYEVYANRDEVSEVVMILTT